jgi:hypothetical protein
VFAVNIQKMRLETARRVDAASNRRLRREFFASARGADDARFSEA